MFASKKHLPRPLVETGPGNHLASFGKPEKAKKHSLATKILGLNNILMAKVRSDLAREQCQSSLGACSLVRSLFRVRPEFVRSSSGVCPKFVRSSFGVRSEFVRSLSGICSEFARSLFGVHSEFVRSSEFAWSLFGVRSEFVHEEPGASEKRLPRKTRSAPYYVVCGQNPKNVPMQDLLQITAFFVKTRNCRRRKPNLPKYEQNLGSNTTHFAAYRRGSFIVKLFPKNSSSPFFLAAKTHFCLDDPKPLSAGASSCLTPKA